MARNLFNARSELFALMLLCQSSLVAGEMLSALQDIDYFALGWSRETYRRIKERYSKMNIGEQGVLNFTSLISDDALSEETRERLESGRKKFLNEDIDKKEVIAVLSKFRKLRRLNELSEHINTALHQGDEVLDPDEIIKDLEEHVMATKAGNGNVADWFYHMGTEFNLQPVLARIMSDTERSYVPTGIPDFDEKNGGINYGAMMLVAGTTGGGKSLVTQNIVQNMSMYEDTLIVPLEMSAEEMVSRMMAREGKVDIHKITGKKWNEEEKERALEGLKKFHKKVKKQGNRCDIFRPEQDMTIDEILMASHPYNYRVIAIDYISLLKGADGDDQWRELGKIARAAKVYAATYNKVVIILAQLSDEGQVRYARSLLEHANNAWVFVATEHTKEQGIIDVKQPKARNQDPTPFTLEVEYKYMSINSANSGSKVKDEDDNEDVKPKTGNSQKSGAGGGNARGKPNASGKRGQKEDSSDKGARKVGSYFDNIGDL